MICKMVSMIPRRRWCKADAGSILSIVCVLHRGTSQLQQVAHRKKLQILMIGKVIIYLRATQIRFDLKNRRQVALMMGHAMPM